MVMYREVYQEVQNKCPGEGGGGGGGGGGGVWCRGFMSWGDTSILVVSRGVQLYYECDYVPHSNEPDNRCPLEPALLSL